MSYHEVAQPAFGLRLRRLRQEKGRSHARSFARLCGIEPETLGALEGGRLRFVRLRTLRRLALELNVHPNALLAG